MGRRKKSIEEQAREQNEELFGQLGWVPDTEVCLLLSASTRLGSSDLEVDDVYRLKDGSLVVHTTEGSSALLEEELLSSEEELVKSHGDRRGVLSFRDSELTEVRACDDYDSAVATVGKRGEWLLSPKRRREYARATKL